MTQITDTDWLWDEESKTTDWLWDKESKTNVSSKSNTEDEKDLSIYHAQQQQYLLKDLIKDLRETIRKSDVQLQKKELEFNNELCRLSAERNKLAQENEELKEKIAFLTSRKGIRLRR